MEAKFLKPLGLEKSNQSDIIGIFSNSQTYNCHRYSMFVARLNKIHYEYWLQDNNNRPVVTGTGKDSLAYFNLTEYNYDNYHHWIKEYHPDSSTRASETPLIYRYNLSSILPDVFVGKWGYSTISKLPLISRDNIEASLYYHGQFCFVTIPKKERGGDFNLESIRPKMGKYLDIFNDVLQNEHPPEASLPFHRITLDRLVF